MVTPVKSNQQHIFIHDALVEGPVEGLVYGDASIFLNGNRVKDIDPDAPWTPVDGKVTFSGTSVGSVSENIPVSMAGTPKNNNFAVLRNSGITKSSASAVGANGNITITPESGSTFSSLYNTFNESATFPVINLVNESLNSTINPSTGGSGYTTSPLPTVKVVKITVNGPQVVPNVTATPSVSGGSITSLAISETVSGANSGLSGTFTFEISTPPLIDDRHIVLADPETNAIIAIGEGEYISSTSLKFIPLNSNYNQYYWLANTNVSYKVQVLEIIKITSINAVNNTITLENAPSAGTGTYSFSFTGSKAPSPDELDAETPASSNNFVAQFRAGSTFQDPITELNGVGGGVSYTATNLNNTILRQINYTEWNSNNPSDTLTGVQVHSTSDYPEGQSITSEGNTEPFVIEGSNFSTNPDVVKSLDEVRISIAYNSLQAIRKDNGDDIHNYAKYLIQIARKAPGASGFEKYKGAFRNADGNVAGQIQHQGKDRSPVSFEHYIDLSYIKPFDDFKIRIFRLTRPKGRAVQAGGGDAPPAHDTDQGDSTSSISNAVAINKDKFSYPYTAHAGLFLDSREFTSVPRRSYEIRGMKVKVPDGYKPREYSSVKQSKTDAKSGTTAEYTVPTYPAFWSGTFSDELYYTNNPVWVFLDIITNDRFGAGEWINLSDIDIYSLYRVSKYCDELVPDGKGGFEPRFTANLYLSKATDVYKVVKDMATIFSSLVYWMDGNLSTVLDSPGDPVYSFSKANVVDGAFVYESTGQKTRVNQVVVSWNNPSIGYEQSNIVVEDRNDIVASGRVISENAVAFGCTSEGQARRFGKWKLFTAQGQSEVVSFKTSFEGLFLKPGDIIEVQDASRYGATLSGRISEVDTSGNDDEITLDRAVTLDTAANDYKLNVLITESAAFYVGEDDLRLTSGGTTSTSSTDPLYSRGDRITTNLYVNIGGSYTSTPIDTEEKASNAFYLDTGPTPDVFRPIELSWKKDSFVESLPVSGSSTPSGGSTVITVNGAFDSTPAVSSVWMLEETLTGTTTKTTGSPDLYKILGISQDEKNIYSISAVEHYNEKYAFVDDPDSIIDVPDDVYPEEEETVIAPSGVRILQNSNAARPNEELTLEWDYPEIDNNGDPTSRFLDTFEILHTIPGRENIINVSNRTRSLALENVPDGTYMFRVRAISVSQKKSAWTSFKYTVDDPFDDKVNRIKGIQTEGLTSVFPFITNESSANGNFRGVYDSTAGTYSSSNKGGYSVGDIVSSQNTLYYLPSGGTVNNISTWSEYRGGLLKFSGTSNAIVAPSRFRRNDAVNLGSSFSIDCNLLRRKNESALDANSTEPSYIGGTETKGNSTVRTAFAVLDNSENTVKLVDNKVDSDLGGVLYWYDLAHADSSSNTGVYKHWKDLTNGGSVSIGQDSNRVEGTNTNFTELNNLDVVLFTKDLFDGTPRTNVSFTASTKTINVGGGYSTISGAGDILEIESSSGLNEGRFTVVSRNHTEIVVAEDLVDESAGATINIHNLLFIARVARVESSTIMYLDRNAPIAIDDYNGGTILKQEYAPDYRQDVLLGKIRNDNNSGTGDFQFDNFLSFDPNLRGGRDVQLDINVAFLQYNPDQEQVFAPDNLTVTATAFGFDKPKFKITYGDPSTAPTDADGNYTIFEDEDTAHVSPDSGALTVYEKEIWDGSTLIPYNTGGAIDIHVEVVEEEDPGDTQKQATDTIAIPRVGDVATGEGGRTVFLEQEDYDIIYNSGGVQPQFTGGPTAANYAAGSSTYNPLLFLRLTATAGAGFGDPIFRFKVGGVVVPKTSGGADWFDPGSGVDIAFVDWPVPYSLSTTTNGVTTTPFGSADGGSLITVVEVAEKPDNWSSTAGDSANEPATEEIYAKDVDNILALRIGAGGLAANFTNDSHVVPCTSTGAVVVDANNRVLRSGGVMKVFSGGVALEYVANNPTHGQWTISDTNTSEDYNPQTSKGIQVGTTTRTQEPNNGPYVATVGNHIFAGSLDDPFEETESITYEITVPQGAGKSDAILEVFQTFSLVKDGAGGVGQVYLYKSAGTANTPSGPTTSFPQVKVNLQTGAIDTTGNDPNGDAVYDGDDEGWYASPNSAASAGSDGQVVWVVAAAVSGSDTFAFIANDDWTTPAQFNGIDGLNSATVEIFARSNDQTATGYPTLPPDMKYTFATGALSAPDGTSNTLGSWSETQNPPSRSLPYVWKSVAAAISNTADTIIDGTGSAPTGEDWSTPIIVNRFVEDGITLELTNDAETVGAATSSTALPVSGQTLSIQTAANVFQAGVDITAHWQFTTDATGAATKGITVNGTGAGSADNKFTVSALSSSFQSDNIAIVATPRTTGSNTDYAGAASRSVNFTITKVANGANGVSYRIVPNPSALGVDTNVTPNTYTGGGGTNNDEVTFTAYKIEDGTSSTISGYWTQSGGTASISNPTSSITVTASGSNDITANFYLDSGPSNLVDSETVPVVPKGDTGTSTTGDPGDDAGKVVTGYLYYIGGASDTLSTVNTARTNVNNTTDLAYNFNNAGFDTAFALVNGQRLDGNFSHSPPAASSTRTKVFYMPYTATETIDSNGNATSSGVASLGSIAEGISFTGLVTFSGTSGDAGSTITDANGIDHVLTQINGSRITTGIIKSTGTSTATVDGSAFTGNNAHSYFNLTNGAIATNNFRIATNGDAAFRGGVTMNAGSSLTNTLTIGSTSGRVIIEGGTYPRIRINDGNNDRVIIGKLQ